MLDARRKASAFGDIQQPGEWTASAESLGEFVFEVASDSTVVTLASFRFKQFQCGSSIAI
jgi:hypothetical protein